MSKSSRPHRGLALTVLLFAALTAAGVPAASARQINDSAGDHRSGLSAPSPGRQSSDVVVTGSRTQQRQATEEALAQATAVNHHLTIVPIHWEEAPPSSPNAAQLQTATAQLSGYYDEVTRGEVRITEQATITDWATIPAPTSCDEDLYWTLIEAAARLAGPLDEGEHLVAVIPRYWKCSWAGRAELGGPTMVLNGDWELRTFAHEFGHNLGLHHANGIRCFAEADHTTRITLSDECDWVEYGDSYDVMGRGGRRPWDAGHLSGEFLRRLGITVGHETLHASREVTLQPLAGTGTGTRLLRIPADGAVYTVEYRTAVGVDGWIDDFTYDDPVHGEVTRPGEGLVIRTSNRDAMLDLHPELAALPSSSPESPAMRVGQSLTTLDGQVRIEYLSNSPQGARVRVTGPTPDTTPPVIGEVMVHDSFTDVPGLDIGFSMVSDADAGLAKVEVFIDGVLVATSVPADPYLAWYDYREIRRLTVGTHTVEVVATDRAGNTAAWGPQEVAIQANGRTPPTFTNVRVAGLRTGTTSARAVPVTLAWSSTAQCGLARHRVTRGSRHWNVGGAARQARASARRGLNAFEVSAFDWCGWRTASAAPYVTAAVDPVTRTGRHGKWSTERGRNLLGGSTQVSNERGAKLAATVRGRSVGWVATTCRRCGAAAVLIDSHRVAVIDLHTRRVRFRRQVWVTNFARPGRHRITIVNLGTRGRSTVSVDGFTSLR